MKAHDMKKQTPHHASALHRVIATLTPGLALCVWAAAALAAGGLPDLFPPSRDKSDLFCSSAPPKCVEKSAEDLRYERILEALKKMEGGERIYSATATPANEPASYGPSQMLIGEIIKRLKSKGGAEYTFTAKNGSSYTLTQQHLNDALKRGHALYSEREPDLLDEAARHNDFKSLTMPARTATANGFLGKSGIASGEWETWWQRAVAYQKLIKFVDELRKEYNNPSTVVRDISGRTLTKRTDGKIVPDTFYAFVDQKGSLSGTTPAVTYGKRLDELLALAFPHVTGDRRVAFRPYIRVVVWKEGLYSFYNRGAYSHPAIPYEVFKEGLAKWFDATPAAEESFIREGIKAAAQHPDVNKDVKILHPDADEEKIARYFASQHNSGGFMAIFGKYAKEFVEHWKKVKWNFKCGADPRKPQANEPKEAQA